MGKDEVTEIDLICLDAQDVLVFAAFQVLEEVSYLNRPVLTAAAPRRERGE